MENKIMNTFILLSYNSNSIVCRIKAETRDEAVEIFAEMGYYQEDYCIQTLESYNDIKQVAPYRMRGVNDDFIKKTIN